MRATAADRGGDPDVHARIREQILEVLADEIRVRGRAGLPANLARVAERLGIARSAIYYYFQDRDDLLRSLLTVSFNKLDAVLDDAERCAATPGERLRGILAAHVEFNCRGAGLALFFAEEFGQLPPTVGDRAAHVASRVERCVMEIGDAAGRPTDVRRDIMMAKILLGCANSVRYWYDDQCRLPPAELGSVYAETLATGLLKSSTSNAARRG